MKMPIENKCPKTIKEVIELIEYYFENSFIDDVLYKDKSIELIKTLETEYKERLSLELPCPFISPYPDHSGVQIEWEYEWFYLEIMVTKIDKNNIYGLYHRNGITKEEETPDFSELSDAIEYCLEKLQILINVELNSSIVIKDKNKESDLTKDEKEEIRRKSIILKHEETYYKNIMSDKCGYASVCSDYHPGCGCSPTAKVSQGFDNDTYESLRKEKQKIAEDYYE